MRTPGSMQRTGRLATRDRADTDDLMDGAVTTAKLSSAITPIGANVLRNAQFQVNQRGESTYTAATTDHPNDDAAYQLDGWKLLSNGNDIVDISTSISDKPTGAARSLQLAVQNANTKFGVAQFLEAADARNFQSDVASISFQAKSDTPSGLSQLRAGLIEWTGGADSPTADPISAWNGASTDPTLTASYAFANTPSDLTLTASWQEFKIENVSVGSSVSNLVLFIWSNDITTTASDVLRLANVKLEKGSVASRFEPKSLADDLAECQYYFYQQKWDRTGTTDYIGSGYVAGTVTRLMFLHPVRMRTTPTVASFNDTAYTDDANVKTSSSVSFEVTDTLVQPAITMSAAENHIHANLSGDPYWEVSCDF